MSLGLLARSPSSLTRTSIRMLQRHLRLERTLPSLPLQQQRSPRIRNPPLRHNSPKARSHRLPRPLLVRHRPAVAGRRASRPLVSRPLAMCAPIEMHATRATRAPLHRATCVHASRRATATGTGAFIPIRAAAAAAEEGATSHVSPTMIATVPAHW